MKLRASPLIRTQHFCSSCKALMRQPQTVPTGIELLLKFHRGQVTPEHGQFATDLGNFESKENDQKSVEQL